MRVSPNVSGTAGQLIRHDAARPEGVPRDVGWPTAREPPRLLRSAQHQSKGRGKQGASGRAVSRGDHKARQPGREPVPGVLDDKCLAVDASGWATRHRDSGVFDGTRRGARRRSSPRRGDSRGKTTLRQTCHIGANERLEQTAPASKVEVRRRSDRNGSDAQRRRCL